MRNRQSGSGEPSRPAVRRRGRSPEFWDVEFIDPEIVETIERSMPYGGPRRPTAFQLDRAIYDDILLRHAEKVDVRVVGRLDRKVARPTVKSAEEESIHVHWNRDEARRRRLETEPPPGGSAIGRFSPGPPRAAAVSSEGVDPGGRP